MAVLTGCVDEPWVRDYVAKELEPLKTGRLKPLEDSLAEIRTELQLLRKEVDEMAVQYEIPESLEQTLEENREYLQWLQEDVDEIEVRLTALEATAELPMETEAVPGKVEPAPPAVPEVAPPVLPEGVRPSNEKVEVPEAPQESIAELADEVQKLRARINDISRHIDHIDQQYQQYHGDVGRLRVDVMDEIDTLNDKILVLDEKILDLKHMQKAILAEMAEQSQRNVESIEQRLRELIKKFPGKKAAKERAVLKEEAVVKEGVVSGEVQRKEEQREEMSEEGAAREEVQKKQSQPKQLESSAAQDKEAGGSVVPPEQKLKELIERLPRINKEVQKGEGLEKETQGGRMSEEGRRMEENRPAEGTR